MVEAGLIYVYGMVGYSKCTQDLDKAFRYLTMAKSAPFTPLPYR